MEKFLIHVIDYNTTISYGMPCCVGEIQINEFKETFDMPTEWWSVEDYKQQWLEGLERIKTHNSSCLVATIQDPTKAPWVNMWVLYKEHDVVYIQNFLLQGKLFIKDLKKMPFTRETCYNFIDPRETLDSDGITKISEWSVNYEDILNAIDKLNNERNI